MFSHKKTKQIISALFLWVLQYFVSRLINLNLKLKLSIKRIRNKKQTIFKYKFLFF